MKKVILKTLVGLITTALIFGIGYGIKHYFTSEPLLAQNTTLIENNSNDIKILNAKVDSTQPAQIQQQVNDLKQEFSDFKKEVKENEEDRKEDHKDVMKYIIDIYKHTNNNPQ